MTYIEKETKRNQEIAHSKKKDQHDEVGLEEENDISIKGIYSSKNQ